MASKPKFLIVGGGFAGVALAQGISDHVDVTLVDRKSYFEITWATVRAIVDNKVAERIVIPYEKIPKLGKVVQASVTSLTATEATLSNGEVLSFDYAAICTGSNYSDKFGKSKLDSAADRLNEFKVIGKELESTGSVLVVGGGPSGVEVAAEIVHTHPGKKVTLVHSKDRLLDGQKEGLGTATLKWLQSKGVQVILGDKVDKSAAPGSITTSKGTSVEAESIMWCTGGAPATSFLTGGLAQVVNDKGLIKVSPTLQVKDYPNLYAIGDSNDVPETKKGYLARMQALMVAKNFVAKLKKASAKQDQWKPGMGFEAMFVSLGPDYGVAQMGSWVLKGFLPTRMKSRDLFIGQTRKQLQLKA